MNLEDPKHALTHPPLPRGPGHLPRGAPGLRATCYWSFSRPAPRELLVHIRQGKVPMLKMIRLKITCLKRVTSPCQMLPGTQSAHLSHLRARVSRL